MVTIHDSDRERLLRRSRLLSALSILVWIGEILLIYVQAPFGLVLSVGVVGAAIAIWDRSFIKKEVEKKLLLHLDPDVVALIAEEITIGEYRKRKESKE
jgi:hypothetical protein